MFMSGNMEESFIDEILRQKKSKRKGEFNPTHSEVEKAVNDFLDSGKTIKKVVPDWEKSFENFINVPSDNMEAMSFLAGTAWI